MFFLLKGLYRIYHVLQLGLLHILPFKKPEILEGEGSVSKLAKYLKKEHIESVLIVTDENLRKIGLLDGLLEDLSDEKINYNIFDQVEPNPSIATVLKAKQMYLDHKNQAIIAFGGGSPMDCAKIAGASVSNPNTKIEKMKGLFRIWKKLPPLYAIPTTAGTGSETTAAAVISNPEKHQKFAIISLKIIPKVAVLDPLLTKNLPPHITSTTGMDALTHAIEAFIGVNKMKETDEMALKATRMIFENLEEAYNHGENLEARNNMALASFYAGIAFTQANVGYVHAIAHNLGGFYGIPHGLANAIILPHVLRSYGGKAEKKLAQLAVVAGIGNAEDTDHQKTKKFIEAIEKMNERMQIPKYIKELKEEDFPELGKRIAKEGNPLYPVPKLMGPKDFEHILDELKLE